MDLPTIPSIGPEVWGRSFWEFLDAIVAIYPKENPSAEQRTAMHDLLQSLQYLLPCPTCRKHYHDFVQTHSLEEALSSRRSLMNFYFLLKKDVSVRTGKGFSFPSPDDLWLSILRRLRLVANTPVARLSVLQKPLQKPTGRVPFRVPRRASATAAVVTKKGCACGKK